MLHALQVMYVQEGYKGMGRGRADSLHSNHLRLHACQVALPCCQLLGCRQLFGGFSVGRLDLLLDAARARTGSQMHAKCTKLMHAGGRTRHTRVNAAS
eukprot:182705-Chlamydomonas_euryale.AAC.8